MALMLVRNYGFGARFRAHAQADLVPIKSVEHKFANGSESTYLHIYPIPDKVQAANASPSCYEPENDSYPTTVCAKLVVAVFPTYHQA